MTQVFNVYCDESCHLENDETGVMVLGAVFCPIDNTHEIANQIRQIKKKHNLSSKFEIKWVKVSPAKVSFYADLINYFFDQPDLSFRGLVVPDKSKLQHTVYNQTHDDWYYKMYFNLLKVIFEPNCKYRIYLDIKDTHGQDKRKKLHDVICSSFLDFDKRNAEKIQPVRSHEVEQIQIADLLTAALAYANRGLNTSSAKTTLVDLIKKRCGYSLTQSTLLRERKFNIFVWQPQGDIDG